MKDTKTLRLDQLPTTQTARIIAIHTSGLLQQKLFNMGFIPGADVEMIRAAPLLDPLEVKLLDYLVTLRRTEAHFVEVTLP
ncbi:hypothetical protein B9T11_02105 [Wohlfahrtiimonas chitiniclastica]|uniref:FeoA family protein n=1 Tax=Wohlfahrtiimonas chitiniclastica TaxID=400946 RepID=UPI000B98AE91|nr:FeoA family protein [Wohlfahrtiimonas chitiniclastica]OYQ71198.1 hypothetical protein B9T13_00640 [Wohlfahrtiimonas chitiniclastica]OYQ82952.1 hypothetical protein B9T11_02105 [Wohlfahrtiimonas chitiniclastica]OYQ85015.1 hypothetical protein B9T14_00640 [Wohlfahrtiimonas chitiniclastica]OYQ86751.1 hypothetical protein B9T15_04400 [Wohlfahrtiimonas chitiniclastica]